MSYHIRIDRVTYTWESEVELERRLQIINNAQGAFIIHNDLSIERLNVFQLICWKILGCIAPCLRPKIFRTIPRAHIGRICLQLPEGRRAHYTHPFLTFAPTTIPMAPPMAPPMDPPMGPSMGPIFNPTHPMPRPPAPRPPASNPNAHPGAQRDPVEMRAPGGPLIIAMPPPGPMGRSQLKPVGTRAPTPMPTTPPPQLLGRAHLRPLPMGPTTPPGTHTPTAAPQAPFGQNQLKSVGTRANTSVAPVGMRAKGSFQD